MIHIPLSALRVDKAFLALLVLIGILASPDLVLAQQVQLGTPKYGSFGGGPVDTINLANLNAHFVIPVLHKPGRGLPFNYDLTYDTTVWEPVVSGSTKAWTPVGGWGWDGSALNVGTYDVAAANFDGTYYYWCETAYVDGFGTPHWFTSGSTYKPVGSSTTLWGCALVDTNGDDFPLTSIAQDGSGYTYTAELCTNLGCPLLINGYLSAVTTLTASDGKAIVPQKTIPLFAGVTAGSVLDRNGNEISLTPNGTTAAYKDTVGMTALTTSGGAPYPLTLTYADPNGNPATVAVTYKPYTVKTNFQCPGGGSAPLEYGPIVNALVDRVTLPNGTYYQFSYEATGTQYPGDVTGRLASVNLPTGGTITYAYTGGSNGINCTDGSAAGLTRQTPDGTWTYSRTAGSGAAYTTTIIDPSPSANKTVIQFQGIYDTERQVYQGSSTLLETVNTCYNTSPPSFPCTSTAVGLPIKERAIQTQLGTLYSEHDYFYDSNYGMATEVDDYDWGSAPKGSLLKKTVYTYASNLGTIKSFGQTVTICKPGGSDSACNGAVGGASGGTKVAQTTNNYDERPPTATSGIPQHINPSTGTSRGNLTSVQRWLSSGTGSQLTTQNSYFDTGILEATADPNNNITTYNYSSAFGGAYLTQVSNALSQVTINNYDANTGVPIAKTDPNGQTTTFAYDNMLRPTQTKYPDGGQTTICYTDVGGGTCSPSGPPYCVIATTKITSGSNAVSTVCADNLGRTLQTKLNSDPSGVDLTDTTFDALGRVASVSNPYRSSGDPTYGITCNGTVSGGSCQKNGYDALGRITTITDQDGSTISASYSGKCTTVTDEAKPTGHARKSCSDGLGRITQLFEDPSGLNYETDYQYDALGNLLCVAQKGTNSGTFSNCASTPSSWRPRTFTYDSLSRVLQATTPEGGTVCYGAYSGTSCQQNGYDGNGNLITRSVAKQNQSSTTTYVTTGYTYDPLNRLTTKSYSDGTTPAVNYFYDGATPGCSVGSFAFGNNVIGRRTAMCDGGGSEAWAFDPMGRILSDQRTTNSVKKTATYAYNYDGTLATLVYPSGDAFTYLGNAAEQPISVTDSTNNISYASSALYAPFGGLSSLTNSSGIKTNLYYNARLQPCRFAVKSSGTVPTSCSDSTNSGNVLDQIYNFNLANGDNGYVAKISDNRTGMSVRNINYTYDSLNRIASAYTDSTTLPYCWAETYQIDSWSNVTSLNMPPKPGYTGCGTEAFSQSANVSNQLPSICTGGSCYDAPGNLRNDSAYQYFYDAENRVCSASGTSCTTGTVYTYDGDGRRVEKSSGTIYWYDTGNSVLDETDLNGNLKNEYIFFNGKRIARRQIR
jgi:YD repeat-containing protein